MASIPFRVKAVYEYSSAVDDDLNFPNGQIITVTDQEEDDWYTGEYMDSSGVKKEGMFPRNFVERYEPQTPPRPSRPNRAKKEPEPSLPVESVKSPSMEEPPKQVQREPESSKPMPTKPEAPHSPLAIQRQDSIPPAQAEAPKSTVSAPAVKKPPPPTVAEKPSGGSFRDRIAAFNKPAAAPIAPFKPGSGGTGFIKKPFVAPPPSKDAYVHQPREPPAKIYRREEDPDVTDSEPREIQATPMAVAAPTESGSGDAEEDQPKPTSLKERIALLQKQQLEAANRHAEAAQKKEKPKRPPKKRTESHEPSEYAELERGANLERLDSHETVRKSMEETQDEVSSAPKPPSRAQRSGDSYLASPPPPSRELVSDTNDADYSGAGDTEEADETSTSKEDSDEKSRPPPHAPRTPSTEDAPGDEDEASNEEEGGEEEEEEEEEMDPEVKRKMELRERMAKMSGGYGMMGMFGPPGGMPGGAAPKKSKLAGDNSRKPSADQERAPPVAYAPPVPIMPLPGMGKRKDPEPEVEVEKDEESEDDLPITSKYDAEDMPNVEEVETLKPSPPRQSLERGAPPPVPGARSVPVPPLTQARAPPPPAPREPPLASPPLPESRPLPPPPSRAIRSPTPGEESDDEMSLGASRMSLSAPDVKEAPSENKRKVPLIPIPGAAPIVPSRPGEPRSPNALSSPMSPIAPGEKSKRTIRAPPVPLASPGLGSPTQSRPPPPPPPGEPPSRRSTMSSSGAPPVAPRHQAGDGDGSDEETTEYDGDYDTDIASSAKHKDALKSHLRDSSLDEGTITDEPSSQSPTSPPANRPPPLPPVTAPRGVPPPPPPGQPPKSRKSTEVPRSAPPPIPPARDHSYHEDDDEYDPYNHTKSSQILQSPTEEPEEDDLYEAYPPVHSAPPPPSDRGPPPSMQPMNAPPPTRGAPRQSLDLPPLQPPPNRRSMEAPRPSSEHSFIATDVDLAQSTIWWSQPNTPAPVFQNRRDILYEIEESTSTQRGGKKAISKDLYVLYMDYSQTVISVRFDALIPKDITTLSQHHEPPPSRLRQDQLEAAHAQFGARIADAANGKQNSTVGDGTPQALILELLRPLSTALLPIGTRAYGAVVYSNLANASTQQFDEIRPGDIVSFRNAKFQGHRGAMHQKYSSEVGKPDHVAIVVDWDGTKKKVRAWEQGRESKKVKMESFKLGELRSGEVRVWRVMGRGWVGWEGEGGKA